MQPEFRLAAIESRDAVLPSYAEESWIGCRCADQLVFVLGTWGLHRNFKLAWTGRDRVGIEHVHPEFGISAGVRWHLGDKLCDHERDHDGNWADAGAAGGSRSRYLRHDEFA